MSNELARARYEDHLRTNGTYTEDEINTHLAEFDATEKRFARDIYWANIAAVITAVVVVAMSGFGLYKLVTG